MLLFSFEVDTLEITLHEVLDLVDVVFLVESTLTHKAKPKPLMWERIKNQERFKFVNQSKVVHVVVDDAMYSRATKFNLWQPEFEQTWIGVDRILLWNNYTHFLGNTSQCSAKFPNKQSYLLQNCYSETKSHNKKCNPTIPMILL